MIDKLSSAKNKLFFASFGLGIASTVALCNPNPFIRNTGFALAGSTATGLACAEFVTGIAFGALRDGKKELDDKLTETAKQLLKAQKDLDKKIGEFDGLRIIKEGLETQLKGVKDSLQTRDVQLLNAKNDLKQLQVHLSEIGKFSATSAYEIVRNTYNRSVKKLEALLDALFRNYPDVQEELQGVYTEVDKFRKRFHEKLNDYETIESFNELLDVGLELQQSVIDRCVELKVKAQTIVIRYLNSIVQDSVSFSTYEEHIENLTSKAIEQIESLKQEHELNERAIAQEWVESNNNMVNKYETEFADVVNTAKYSVKRMQEMEQTIEALKNRIGELEKPIEWRVTVTDAQRVGVLIIRFFANKGIKLDRSHIDNDPYEPVLYFHVNRLDDVVLADDLNKFSEALQQHIDLILEPPHFTYNGALGLMQTKLKLAQKPKPTKEELLSKIPECKSLVSGSGRGFLITGAPGAGKTSAMKAISQWLADEKAMRLALNPHSDNKSRFDDAGFVEVNDLDDIYEALAQLDKELLLRGKDKTRRHPLIVAVDELGRILKNEPKDLDVMETLKQAAVEGRKFNVIVLIGNHSQTTTAIDMDSQFRDAFYQMFLVGAALQKLNMPNSPALKSHEEEWIRSATYPVLTCINGRYQACQHPTHYTYQEYKDVGNPPVGLIELKPNTVTLGTNTYFASTSQTEFTEQQKQLIDENKDMVNLQTSAGISRLIEIVFGIKASKSNEYKELKDKVLAYLKAAV
jgi:hypothetical protein